MAETRKHQQVARDDLDRAIHAALGEDVRPFTPGEDPYTASDRADEPDTWRPGHLPPSSALGAFTFNHPRPTGSSQD